MIAILASLTLSCSDATWIIQGMRETDLSEATRADMILTVMGSTEDDCDFTSESERNLR